MNVVLFLRKPLEYLVEEFQAEVPSWVLQKLEKIPITPEEQALYVHKTSDFEPPSTGCKAAASMLWQAHSKRFANASALVRLLHLPFFLKDLWGLSHLYELPTHLIRLVLKTLSKR